MLQSLSESVEYYTPPAIIARAVATFGEPIDLDPATCVVAQRSVQAQRGYTRLGLRRSWRARTLWLNPPYTRAIVHWTERLRRAYLTGEVDQAMALLPARTDTVWLRPFYTDPVELCFVYGRIKFIDANGVQTESGGKFPSVIVYFGDNRREFYREFETLGAVGHMARIPFDS